MYANANYNAIKFKSDRFSMMVSHNTVNYYKQCKQLRTYSTCATFSDSAATTLNNWRLMRLRPGRSNTYIIIHTRKTHTRKKTYQGDKLV